MQIISKKIGEIRPYEKNAKEHPVEQVDMIANSIKEFGFNQPIVVDKEGVIIVGHGRFEAAKKLGIEEVPVLVADLNEQQAKSYRLADNKLNESEWDMDKVIAELKDLSKDMVELTGFSFDLTLEAEEKDNEIPDVPESGKEKTKLGDVYELGQHRVVCGDSLSESDVETLFNGKKAKVLFTSPPYNMDGGMYETYEDNLASEEYIQFNMDIVNMWKEHLNGFLFWNISYNTNSRSEFIEVMYKIIKETGLKFLELIVWNKKHAMPIISKEAMTRQYEDILVVGDEESIREDLEMGAILRNTNDAYFNRKTRKWLRNYWELSPIGSQLDNHKACYPVELPLRGMQVMSVEGELVSDPFLGSGSTLIAAHKSGRICYGMELDPKYVDVIVQRWVNYTGITKVIKNGEEMTWERKEAEKQEV